MTTTACRNDPRHMIAVDTSALLAIVLAEPDADACIAAMENETRVLMSAGTLAEALIVAARRKRAREMARLVDGIGIEIVPVTQAVARRVAETYERWGKGVNPAGLNFGDCFSYEVAKQHSCPLLFVGEDFSKTDVERVLQESGGKRPPG